MPPESSSPGSAPPRPRNRGRLIRFARALGALTPEAWERIAAGYSHLDGDGIRDIATRERTFWDLVMPMPHPTVRRVATTILSTLGVARELRNEFITDVDKRMAQDRARELARADGAEAKEGTNAFFDIQDMALARRAEHPGLAMALRTIELALMSDRRLGRPELAELYAPLEPEIPLASILDAQDEAPG